MKQRCVLNEGISKNENFSFSLGFYINQIKGERELITGETEREHIKVSISTKFRKVIQENRVGDLQDKMFVVDNILWLTTVHVDQD